VAGTIAPPLGFALIVAGAGLVLWDQIDFVLNGAARIDKARRQLGNAQKQLDEVFREGESLIDAGRCVGNSTSDPTLDQWEQFLGLDRYGRPLEERVLR
jgi:uncharacterized protein YmfQ (DUF2313 family)